MNERIQTCLCIFLQKTRFIILQKTHILYSCANTTIFLYLFASLPLLRKYSRLLFYSITQNANHLSVLSINNSPFRIRKVYFLSFKNL